MEGLINKSLKKEDLDKYLKMDEMPMRNTVANHPSINFKTDLHSILYQTMEDRDSDFQTIIKMY